MTIRLFEMCTDQMGQYSAEALIERSADREMIMALSR